MTHIDAALFISTPVIRAATAAAQLHLRIQGDRFTAITLAPNLQGTAYNLTNVALGGPDGTVFTALDRPGDHVFLTEEAIERQAAAATLAALIATMPVLPGGLRIPLRPGR
ncbi:hypothetical protein G3I60_04980 [Streptomyces sp. SID13666]|uniref:hypothetical protein n=1 Tax=Streptomyces sp. SID13666 TaxID=2706054 RepID=UPI0013C0F706|nr:hypothetical protein [Streptomyces sp. SID13666]NEA53523.1 hypothetical protein [Streptomyces sp. SID13666]